MGGSINNGVYRPVNLSLYTYTFNHPINHTDPNGEFGWVGALVGGVVSVGVDYTIASLSGEEYTIADAGKSFTVGAVSGAVGAGIGTKAAQGYRALRGQNVLNRADRVGIGMLSGTASGASATVIDETVDVELGDGTLAIEFDPYGIDGEELARGAFTGMITGGIVEGASTGEIVEGALSQFNLPGKSGKILGDGTDMLTDIGVGQSVSQGTEVLDPSEPDAPGAPLRLEITIPNNWSGDD